MPKEIDLTGMRFGYLTVLERDTEEYIWKNNARGVKWICRCDCGNTKSVLGSNLRSDKTRSCGCLSGKRGLEKPKREKPRKTEYDSRLKGIYGGMMQRCYNENLYGYRDYGGRGIKICEEWYKKGGFWKFRDWALANGYREDLSIDRIDNDKGYSPDNCRWATTSEQNNNKRNNIIIEIDGQKHSLTEWAEILKIKKRIIQNMRAMSHNEEEFKERFAFEIKMNKRYGPPLSASTKEEYKATGKQYRREATP